MQYFANHSVIWAKPVRGEDKMICLVLNIVTNTIAGIEHFEENDHSDELKTLLQNYERNSQVPFIPTQWEVYHEWEVYNKKTEIILDTFKGLVKGYKQKYVKELLLIDVDFIIDDDFYLTFNVSCSDNELITIDDADKENDNLIRYFSFMLNMLKWYYKFSNVDETHEENDIKLIIYFDYCK